MDYEIVMPFLHPWQKDVFDAVTNDNGASRQYCVRAKRQVGKSICAISIILYYAFKNDYSIGVIIEPVLHQSRRIYRQIINAIGGEDSELIKHANSQLLEIELINGSQIILKSSEQGQALRGLSVRRSCLVLDEGAYLPDDTYEILAPVVDACKCPTLIISTPQFRSGEFYKIYTRGLSENPFVKSFDWTVGYDMSVFLSKEKLAYYRETMTEMRFRSEILGEWLDDFSYVFGNFQKNYGYSQKPPKYAGVDWSAGEGNDYTCLVFLDEDGCMTDVKSWKEFDATELVGTIAELINASGVKAVQVEKNSIGKIYRDMLKKRLKNGIILSDFLTTNESKRRVVEQLIVAFQNKDITIIEDKELTRELQNYGIEKLKNGGYTYNGQNNVNDDYVIALALAYDAAKKYKNNKGLSFGFA